MKRKKQLTSKQYYFAYGSNLLKAQMKLRCPSSSPLALATLNNFKLTFKSNKRGNGVADIVPSKDSEVLGALYQVTADDIKRLDKFEGHPFVYKRQNVTVETDEGKVIAIAYIMKPEFIAKAPKEDYLQKIILGYQDWNLPEENLEEFIKEMRSKSE